MYPQVVGCVGVCRWFDANFTLNGCQSARCLAGGCWKERGGSSCPYGGMLYAMDEAYNDAKWNSDRLPRVRCCKTAKVRARDTKAKEWW